VRAVLLLALFWLLAGCAELPFPPGDLVPLGTTEPATVVEKYQRATPEKFSQLNSIVFEIAGQKFLGIGFLDIDRTDRTFRVICLNPMGVKLFDLSGDDHGTTLNFAIEPLTRFGDIATAVGNDIRRIYFGLAPRRNATPRVGSRRITFGGGVPDGYQEHVYAGRDGDLVEKRMYDDRSISWSVGYFDYQEREGKRFPRGIVLTDYRGGYQLTIREKEQPVEESQRAD